MTSGFKGDMNSTLLGEGPPPWPPPLLTFSSFKKKHNRQTDKRWCFSAWCKTLSIGKRGYLISEDTRLVCFLLTSVTSLPLWFVQRPHISQFVCCLTEVTLQESCSRSNQNTGVQLTKTEQRSDLHYIFPTFITALLPNFIQLVLH